MMIQTKDPARYYIIESDLGPLISESRSTVYDVLEAQNKGLDLYEISISYNLTPSQVETALQYIEQHRTRLQTELDEILRIAAERRHNANKVYAAIRKEIEAQPITPERARIEAIKAQILARHRVNADNSQ